MRIAFYLSILMLVGCDSTDPFKYPEAIGFPHNETLHRYKERVLPGSFIECNDSFYWNTIKFDMRVAMQPSNHPDHIGEMAIVADNPTMGPMRSGWSSSSGFELTGDELRTCYDIYKRITGDSDVFMKYQIYQIFDYEKVSDSIKSSSNYQAIEANHAVLKNSAFKYDGKKLTDELVYKIWLPVSVKCENKWSVKRDPQDEKIAVFQQPKGKCELTVNDYRLDLPSGQKIVVALRGFYEKDPEYPQQRMLVQIERYGFKDL